MDQYATPATPRLRVTTMGRNLYLGPFLNRWAVLDAARVLRSTLYPETARFQIDNGGHPPDPPGYFEDVEWELRQDEWWPSRAMYAKDVR
jgi:hypothetical protein